MVRERLGSIRGQLVLWYLTVLAVVLLALGVFQSLTLSSYLQTNTADSLRDTTFSELRVLGPCFVSTSTELEVRAQSLAQLLGSRETAVKIVTPDGAVLADHSFGIPGHIHPFRLSADSIRILIHASPSHGVAPDTSRTACSSGRYSDRLSIQNAASGLPPTILQNDKVLMAFQLGPPGYPVGYAILGRSISGASDTVRRTRIIFGLGALVALLLAAGIAVPIINRALRPLRRVADTATAIAAGDMERRANLSRSRDEIGRLGTAFDTMVDRLQEALSAAHESENRMRRFLGDASHELRTPLTVLRGMSEVLLRRNSDADPQIQQGLHDIHEESVRLSTLVDDLLTLTRLDAGGQLTPTAIDVKEFLGDFAERYGPAWQHRRLDVRTSELDGVEAYVDSEALRRMLTNLVDNAARYSTPGTPVVLAGRLEGESVNISVSDGGPGMNEEDAARVFERFYRSAKNRTRDSGGSGLGLAIVRSLAEGSNGAVALETGPGKGTTVTVKLPRAREVLVQFGDRIG